MSEQTIGRASGRAGGPFRLPYPVRLALRELRGGLAGFRIFLICLALGVGGIAAVGSVAEAIRAGLAAEGQAILGGDIAITYTYRFADEAERRWMRQAAAPRAGDTGGGAVSETVDFRSMLALPGSGGDRALAQVKGVDAAYPLYGALKLAGELEPAETLAERDGLHGLVTEPVLAERLGLAPGDEVRLGAGTFEFRGTIVSEPDAAAQGFALGPRVIASIDGLRAAGLLGPGTIFDTIYRLRVPPEKSLAALQRAFERKFPDAGARWRDRRASAPGIERFVDRLGAFMTLVGLAALIVGGVGVGAAVRGYLGRKVAAIAALRTLGASAGTVFSAYLIQVGLIACLGVLIGLLLGAGAILLAGPWLAQTLPVPAVFTLYPQPLVVAALFGLMTAIVFTLWPLSWLREVRPAELFREERAPAETWPRPSMLAILGATLLLFGAAVVMLSGAPQLALWVIGAIGAALLTLRGLGWAMARAARGLSHQPLARRRPVLRLALGALGGPRNDTANVVMALGLGLGVLAAIGQVDANMQRLIRDQLPAGSPAFFFVDIQPDQLEPFRELIGGIEGTGEIGSAAMLRGVITQLDGVPANEAEIDPEAAWMLRGDRGVSYADRPPENAVLTEGEWWEPGTDEALLSFIDEEGRQLGLDVGSTVTVNILGRPITAKVANFRQVEWRGLGINFTMIMNRAALAGAPHTHIATVHAEREAEAEILRAVGREMPNVTAIGVREQVARVSDNLAKLGAATRWGALAVLLTGLAVLVGAAGAAAERQVYEAAILKVLGASRARILASFALRSALLGAAAGLVALIWGGAAAWAVSHYVLDADFVLAPGQAVAIVLGGALLNLLAGLAFSLRPLRARPARVFRVAEG